MINWHRRLAAAGTVLALCAGGVVIGTGVAAAEVYDAVHGRIHWNMNLTNRDTDVNCPLSSDLTVDFDPTTYHGSWVELQPYDWTEYCGADAHAQVEVRARMLPDHRIEFEIRLTALFGNLATGLNDPTYVIAVPEGELNYAELSRDGDDVDAFARFRVSAHHKQVDSALPEKYVFTPTMQNGDVTGRAEITFWANGQVSFTGNLHNDAFSSKDVRVVCAVHLTDGTAFVFETDGDINGSLASIGSDRSLNWGKTGNYTDESVDIAIDKGELTVDSPAMCALEVDTDTSTDVLSGVTVVIKVFDAIFL